MVDPIVGKAHHGICRAQPRLSQLSPETDQSITCAPVLAPRTNMAQCDQKLPACGQCIKKKNTCLGYRSEADLIFRVENDHAASLVTGRKSRRRSSPQPRLHVSAHLSRGLVAQDLSESGQSPTTVISSYTRLDQPPNFRTLLPNLGDRASCFFIANYILESSDISYGFMEYLPPIVGYQSGSMLSTVIECLGLAAMSNIAGSQAPATIAARRKYGEALSMVNRALQTPEIVTEDQTLLSVMLLGVYEVCNCKPIYLSELLQCGALDKTRLTHKFIFFTNSSI
jgi:hypothetical protein